MDVPFDPRCQVILRSKCLEEHELRLLRSKNTDAAPESFFERRAKKKKAPPEIGACQFCSSPLPGDGGKRKVESESGEVAVFLFLAALSYFIRDRE
jgi:hypothetical protein